MDRVKELENKINSNKNRNTRFVNVKATRVCKSCGQPILKGSKCLTTNKQGVGRQWQCMKCTMQQLDKLNNKMQCETLRQIHQTQFEMQSLPFGDEGGYMALQDWLNEKIATCIDCGKCCEASKFA